MLHDIGMSVDYDDHHKHSRYLILNGGLPGFSPIEVAIIAQAARYHRKGMPEPGPLEPLFGPGDAARLDRCAVLLRLAEDLERSRDQLVRGTRFTLTRRRGAAAAGERATARSEERGEIELRLIADGESAVPRWAAGARDRAVRARLPRAPVAWPPDRRRARAPAAGRGSRVGCRAGRAGYSAESSRSRPAQSNSTRPW